jgi:1-(5-phosphoribosyl)-5-[(5-phosphoribosylamino)methylideneamino] imidazole-4-carboxamide isomerase/N-(5'phosphoribosyl)anthranilate isomerase
MDAMLQLLAAIDIMDGQAVRLRRGEINHRTEYGAATAMATKWVEQGAQWLHVVDLDAAFGTGSNAEVVSRIVHAAHGVARVQVSGGIRDDAAVRRALDSGCDRIVLGTGALLNLDWAASVIAAHKERVVVSLDVKGSTLAVQGWTEDGPPLWETLGQLDAVGCARYVVTDIAKDGTLHGPNLHLLQDVAKATTRPLIASGGVASLEDLHRLGDMHTVEGAILGKALYEDRFTLAEAFVALQARYDPYEWGPPQP